MTTGSRLKRTRKLLFGAVVAAFGFAGCELLAGLLLAAWPQGETAIQGGKSSWLGRLAIDLDAPPGQSLYEPDPELFWRLRSGLDLDLPNAVYQTRGGPVLWSLRINDDGHRGPTYPALSEPPRHPVVIALGDSCTFGFRVDDSATYPRQLESHLRSHGLGGAAVVNYGVPGYTSFQGRLLLPNLLREHRPDVVLLAFGANDQEFDVASDSDKAAQVSLWQLRLGYAVDRLHTARLLRRMASSDRRALPEEEAPTRAQVGAVRRVSGAEYRDNLTAMVKMARAHGARVILLDLVFAGPQFRYTIASVAEQEGVEWLDGRAILRDHLPDLAEGGPLASEREQIDMFWRERVTSYRHAYFDDAFYEALFANPERSSLLRYFMVEPVHANALGNRLIAEAIGERLLQPGL